VYELLQKKDASRFDPSRASAYTYLRLMVLTAITDTYADYPVPGQTTRPRKEPGESSRDVRERLRSSAPLSLDVVRPGEQGEGKAPLGDLIQDPRDDFAVIEDYDAAAQTLHWIEETASTKLARAILLISYDGLTQQQAAVASGLKNRFQLSRMIDALIGSWENRPAA
jgi:hypothetical protein